MNADAKILEDPSICNDDSLGTRGSVFLEASHPVERR